MCQHVFHTITFGDKHCTNSKGQSLPKTVNRCLICVKDFPVGYDSSATYTKEMAMSAIERGFL